MDEWEPLDPIEKEWENGLVFLCRLNEYQSTWTRYKDKAKYAFKEFSGQVKKAKEQLRHLPTFEVTTRKERGKRMKTTHPMEGYKEGDVLGW